MGVLWKTVWQRNITIERYTLQGRSLRWMWENANFLSKKMPRAEVGRGQVKEGVVFKARPEFR